VPDFPTSIGLRADGGAIVGLRDRVALWDYDGEFRALAIVEPDLTDNRLNEGRVGPNGAFWVGTMQNNLDPDGAPSDMTRDSGAIYRVDPNGHVTQLTPREYGITNTMAWTNEGASSPPIRLAEIYAYDLRGGTLANQRVFASPLERGASDGSRLDADGFLWNCRVAGGACVARFQPDDRLDRLVELPCTWPTSCVLGGADFATLYVTSARFTMTAHHLSAHPEEGALFAAVVGPRGRPEFRFG
jgi:sugar lactone lactonase YvrE